MLKNMPKRYLFWIYIVLIRLLKFQKSLGTKVYQHEFKYYADQLN